MIEAKFFTVGTYLYKYNLTVLFVSPSKIAHDKFYIYCPPLLLNEIYAHGVGSTFEFECENVGENSPPKKRPRAKRDEQKHNSYY